MGLLGCAGDHQRPPGHQHQDHRLTCRGDGIQQLLLAPTFKLIPARHRLGLLTLIFCCWPVVVGVPFQAALASSA